MSASTVVVEQVKASMRVGRWLTPIEVQRAVAKQFGRIERPSQVKGALVSLVRAGKLERDRRRVGLGHAKSQTITSYCRRY